MVQKFDFQPLDLQGAYRIKPFMPRTTAAV